MIGNRIKKARTSVNISQTDLANRIGVSKQTLYKYENEIVTNVPSDKIEALSAALGVSPAYLMGWEEVEDQDTFPPLTAAEESHMRKYRKLSGTNRVRIDERIDILLEEEREELKRVSAS